MKFEHTQVMNFKGAIKGMRNPKNSWNKSDSYFGLINFDYDHPDDKVTRAWLSTLNKEDTKEEEEYFEWWYNIYNEWLIKNGILQKNEESNCAEVAYIGPNDMKLAQTLIRAGSEHRKFLRQIFVSVDVTASLYIWKEADTYKVATVANSTSTMHKLTSQPITIDCFEIDDYNENLKTPYFSVKNNVEKIIDFCERLRQEYLKTGDKRYWKELVRWLPEGWLQTRTWTANYETLYSIYHQRKNHKLNEWSGKDTEVDQYFIKWISQLPYAKELIMI